MTPIRRLPFVQVDAFTDAPFSGNPAAVCFPDGPLDSDLMQAIAAEMNLSETAFPEPPDQAGIRRLRWFTPTAEVDLCGHATLAAAHALMARGEGSPLRFDSRSGPLPVHRDDDGRVVLDFPADPPVQDAPPSGLREALGLPGSGPAFRGDRTWLLRLDAPEAVVAVEPDFLALRRIEVGSLGVAVTAPGADGVDFVSRFFGPWVGVDEDPVTGAAHTTLAPYWAEVLGKETLRARQLSRRGGGMEVTVRGERVELAGRAVTVAKGELIVE